MNAVIGAVDFIGLLAFLGAFVALTMTMLQSPSDLAGRASAYCLLAAFGVYVIAMGSNVLEHLSLTAALDPIEDYLEILFPPLVLYSQFSRLMMVKGREKSAAQRAAQASQEMLMAILESTPAGILLLDQRGHISFANAAAKEVLDITENESGQLATPGWQVRVNGADPSSDFSPLLSVPVDKNGIPVDVEWPTGWRVSLTIQTQTTGPSQGRPGGMVAAFLPPQSGVRSAAAAR